LRLLESLTGDLGAERQCRQRENIADDLSLDFQRAVAGNARDRECRIGRQAVADEIRFRKRQFIIRSLQAAIAEQCDLHRAVDCQCPPQQGFDGCIGTLCVIRRPDRNHVLVDGLACDPGDDAHTAIRRERCTSRQQQRR
jgi:hypothetical protein